AYDTAQIAGAILLVLRGRWREAARADEFVSGSEVCPTDAAAGVIRYELPPALAKEAMIASRDELGSILECDSISVLDHAPVCEDFSLYVPSVRALTCGAV